MGFFERWRRGEGGGRGPSLFEPWSGPPAIQGIGAGRGKDLPALLRAAEGLTSPIKYDAALIIGLGQSGEHVLRALNNELALDPAGPQRKVKLVLLTTRPAPTLSLGGVPVRQFDLGRLSPTDAHPSAAGSVRAPLLDRFLHPAFYDPIALYFSNVQKDLRSAATDDQETRVIVVGSLGEPEIGLLGNLMLLLLTSSGGRGISRRVALLSVDSHAPELSPAEQEAALRELGRLTFLGPHVMPHQASQPDNASINALIDYFVLLQNAGGLRAPTAPGAEALPFDLTVGQALAELTYLLLHPSGRDLWAHLQNDLTTTGGARQLTHAPYLHTAGVATLFVPVTELQAYIAARLAQAAVFGERQHTPEGLLARRTPAVSYEGEGPALARAWLRQEGLAHRLTSGLLEATGPESFQPPPPVAADPVAYVPLLPAQVAHALAALLNDGRPDAFERAEAGLSHVQRYLANWIHWGNAANSARASDELRALAFILEQWQAQIGALRGQIGAWRAALGLDRPAAAASPGAPATTAGLPSLFNLPPLSGRPAPPAATPRAGLPPLVGDGPRPTAGLPPLSGSPAASGGTAAVSSASLREQLQQERDQAERRLQAVVGGGVRRPLTAEPRQGGFDGLSEAEKYYRDTIRPEIDQFLTTDSPHFRAITQRLYWWIKLTRSEPPELRLICLPADRALSADSILPPDMTSFGPDDSRSLVRALLDIAGVQAQKTAENLTAGWMLNRLRSPDSRNFLRRAETVYLDFDARRAREQHLETLGTRSYLIGPDVVTLDAVAGHVFPAAVEGVERLDGAEPTRLTALLIQKDIPLQVVRLPQPTQQTYGQPTALYLYDQERLAAQYEARLSGGAGRAATQFPPDFVVALTDAELVRLFCHGVMAGLISVRVTDPLAGRPAWSVPFRPADVVPEATLFPWDGGVPQPVPTRPLDDSESDEWPVAGWRSSGEWLALAAYDPARQWQSLWEAMRAFTLDMPYGRSLEAELIHPFHRDNRRAFLTALRAAIVAAHERPSGNEAMNRRVLSLRNRLAEWRRRYPDDTLALAFFTVLEIEMQRPGAL